MADIRANRWVSEEWNKRHNRAPPFAYRGCDAAIALPGGPGTLNRNIDDWNLMIVDALPPKRLS